MSPPGLPVVFRALPCGGVLVLEMTYGTAVSQLFWDGVWRGWDDPGPYPGLDGVWHGWEDPGSPSGPRVPPGGRDVTLARRICNGLRPLGVGDVPEGLVAGLVSQLGDPGGLLAALSIMES